MASETAAVVSCLYRLGNDPKEYGAIRLDGECNKVTFGRAECNDVCLRETPLASRKHAVMEKIDQHWNITDLGSSNGVWLNGVRITAHVACQLQNRAVLEFGKDVKSPCDAVYRFQFYDKARIVKKPMVTTPPTNRRVHDLCQGQSQAVMSPSTVIKKKVAEEVAQLRSQMEERQHAAEDQLTQLAEMLQMKEEQLQAKEESLEKERESKLSALSLTIADSEGKMVGLLSEKEQLEQRLLKEQASKEDLERMLQSVKLDSETVKNEYEELMLAREVEQHELELQKTNLRETLRARQSELEKNLSELKASQMKLEGDKENLEKCLKEEKHVLAAERSTYERQQVNLKKEVQIMQDRLHKREVQLKTQIEQLRFEKELNEKNVQRKIENELKKKSEEFKKQLKAKESALTSQLTAKEQEQKLLVEKMKVLEEEIKTQANENEQESRKVKEELEDILDTELVCAICSELFVQAVSLECSHSFCKLCIEKWAVQKQECPQCRAKMTARVRSIVLDNYIERAVTFLSEDLSAQRKVLVEERAAELETFLSAQARKKDVNPAAQRRSGNTPEQQQSNQSNPDAPNSNERRQNGAHGQQARRNNSPEQQRSNQSNRVVSNSNERPSNSARGANRTFATPNFYAQYQQNYPSYNQHGHNQAYQSSYRWNHNYTSNNPFRVPDGQRNYNPNRRY